jgi:7-carboxy-7-deazaguanine synthase
MQLLLYQKPFYLTEIFGSVQGETSYTGLPTTFVRFSGCNLRCSWCDTPYSFSRGTPYTQEEILSIIEKHALPYVCITGGEPLLDPRVLPLMSTLCDLGYKVSIETGGSLPIKEIDSRVKVIVDIKCPGSGMERKNHWENLSHLKEQDEVKFVVKDRADFLYAIEVCRNYDLFSRSLFPLFSPVFEALESKELVSWILEEKLPIRLNLQVHKWIWSKDKRGV